MRVKSLNFLYAMKARFLIFISGIPFSTAVFTFIVLLLTSEMAHVTSPQQIQIISKY